VCSACGGTSDRAETTAGSIRATFIVDASGACAWLARQLQLPIRNASRKLIALYGYMQGDCPIRDAAPCFTYLPDGWLWTRASAAESLPLDSPVYHASFTPLGRLSAEFEGLKPVGKVKGSDVTWRFLEGCAGRDIS